MITPPIKTKFTPPPQGGTTVKNGASTIETGGGVAIPQALKDSVGNNYHIKRFMYPEDLDVSDEYGKNMVVFFINVNAVGKAADGTSVQTVYDIPDEDITKFGGQRIVAAAQNILPIDKLVSAKMKRLDTAICMNMPNSVKTGYDVIWGEASDQDMRNAEFLAQSALKVAGSKGLGDLVNNFKEIAGDAAINAAFGSGNKWISKAARQTAGNSKAEQLFEGVTFREFSFSYQFTPKSADEAENILNIIRMFRYHMLPEYKNDNSFMYIYPSEFNIKYYANGTENQFLEKLSTCVLKNVEVDYTPNGQFSTFAYDPKKAGAMPTQINLNMLFQEISKPSKETSPWFTRGL
jgi:hypothetical protein